MSISSAEQSDSHAPLLMKEKAEPQQQPTQKGSNNEYKKQSSLDEWSDKMEEPLGSLMEGMNKVSSRFKSAGGLFAGFGKSMSVDETKEKLSPQQTTSTKMMAAKKSPEVDSKIEPKTTLPPIPPPPKTSPPNDKSMEPMHKPAAPNVPAKPSITKSLSHSGVGEEKMPPRPPPRSPMSSQLSLESTSSSSQKLQLTSLGSSSASLSSPTSPPTIPPPPLMMMMKQQYSPLSAKPPPVTPPTSPRRASQ